MGQHLRNVGSIGVQVDTDRSNNAKHITYHFLGFLHLHKIGYVGSAGATSSEHSSFRSQFGPPLGWGCSWAQHVRLGCGWVQLGFNLTLTSIQHWEHGPGNVFHRR